MINLEKLLPDMNPSELSYQEWLNVGMALKQEGLYASVWDDFSSRDPERYKPGECARKWQTFQNGGGITGATITQIAKDHGWFTPHGSGAIGWDSEIEWDGSSSEPAAVDVIPPGDNWEPESDAIKYIQALFRPGDRIAYCMDAYKDEKDGKWKPGSKGTSRSYEDIIGQLEAGAALSDIFYPKEYTPAAGAWIRCNPVRDRGDVSKNDSVTDFRHAVVECDGLPIEEQAAYIRKLNLPVAALVHSGNKSLHAIVKINAKNDDEYKNRVRKLYDACIKEGFPIDQSNKNPSRLTRLPGFFRGDKKQYLIETGTGAASWAEWEAWIDSKEAEPDQVKGWELLPDIEDFFEIKQKGLPPLKPVLIEGVLREQAVLLLNAPSKAGKSFSLIELAAAFAHGGKWFGFKCKQCRALYINMELDPAACYNRVNAIIEKTGPVEKDMFKVWNLSRITAKDAEGKRVRPTIENIIEKLAHCMQFGEYGAIILDPVYKLGVLKENDAEEVEQLFVKIHDLSNATGAAVIICHHHSKGAAAYSSINRGSGSTVFAREPDAVVDMIEQKLKNPPIGADPTEHYFLVELNVRDFKEPAPFVVTFDYPLHYRSDLNLSEFAQPGREGAADRGRAKQKEEENAKKIHLIKLVKEAPDLQLRKAEAAERLGVSRPTIDNYLKDENLGLQSGKRGCITLADPPAADSFEQCIFQFDSVINE